MDYKKNTYNYTLTKENNTNNQLHISNTCKIIKIIIIIKYKGLYLCDEK